jgi:hypothetical protein
MQIVGTNCAKCGDRIKFIADGVACENCNKVFHQTCLDDPEVCQFCLRRFSQTASGESASRKSERSQQHAPQQGSSTGIGRLIGIGALLILGANAAAVLLSLVICQFVRTPETRNRVIDALFFGAEVAAIGTLVTLCMKGRKS